MSTGANGNRPQPLPPAGEVLHQTRKLPYCPIRMAVGGFLIVSTIGYFVLSTKAKPGTGPADVAKVVGGSGRPN